MAQSERINLGALQQAHEKAKAKHEAAKQARIRAEEVESKALAALTNARNELDGAYRAVTRTV